MQHENEDRRIGKTRLALQNALLELMKEKPLDRISVTELAAAADVNRKTFYNHYHTVTEVRRELDERYMEMIFGFMQEPMEVRGPESLRGFVNHLVDAILHEPVRARLLFESGETLYLTDQMEQLLLPHLQEQAAQFGLSESALAYVLEFIAHGIIAVLSTWLTAEYPMPPAQLKELLLAMISGSIGVRQERSPARLKAPDPL